MKLELKELRLLKKEYGDVKYYLDFNTPFQLLVGVILSAQCTDEVANKVLQELFKHYKTPNDFVKLPLTKLENLIRPTGFYKNKAKGIKSCSKMLVEKFNKQVPDTMDELVKLPYIGRKSANVILQNAFNKVEGIVVDTHVIRLSKRLGWSKHKDAEKIEQDLMQIFPKNEWLHLPHILKAHGRKVCVSKPKCNICVLNNLCPKVGVSEFPKRK